MDLVWLLIGKIEPTVSRMHHSDVNNHIVTIHYEVPVEEGLMSKQQQTWDANSSFICPSPFLPSNRDISCKPFVPTVRTGNSLVLSTETVSCIQQI